MYFLNLGVEGLKVLTEVTRRLSRHGFVVLQNQANVLFSHALSMITDVFFPSKGGSQSHIYQLCQCLIKRNLKVNSDRRPPLVGWLTED